MNLKEAWEIVKQQEKMLDNSKRPYTQTVTQEYNYVYAKAFIQAIESAPLQDLLERAEIKALLEALKLSEAVIADLIDEVDRAGSQRDFSTVLLTAHITQALKPFEGAGGE